MSLALLASWRLTSATFGQDTWTLVSADFQSHRITPVSIDEKSIQSADGSFDWADVLELDHSISPATQPVGDFTLHLNGGDFIGGSPIAIANDTVSWQNRLLGKLDIPEDQVNAVIRAGQSDNGVAESRKADTVRLANGDSSTGVVTNFAGSTLTIQPAGADSTIDLNLGTITAVLLADPDPTSLPAGHLLRLRLSDGSSLSVPILKFAGGSFSAGFTEQSLHKLDPSAVVSIEQIGGPVRWLTSLTPTQIVYHPYFDESFPPQFDHPVADPTVSIRDKFPGFRHGIGVHSYTLLTYAIPDGFKTFRTQFAVDRIPGSDMTKADMTARLLVDGKAVMHFDHVHFGPPADPVSVDVSNAKTLSLVVDYGDNLDAQGRFVWLDPAFLR
ncbi:MAG TPA: NPCBM/NEW2 domain-containing protein [Tepidisphaeraceae bacterium]|nr:NPCBM/NEW2 domain-containing protein [Tepidisphaeraceae bacterium]